MYRSLSVFAGALTAAMVLMNGEVARALGVYGSSVLAHLTGLVGAVLLLALSRPPAPRSWWSGGTVLMGGTFGALAVVLSSVGLVVLGVPLTLGLGLLGQTCASAFIDHFGILGVPQARFVRARAGAMALIVLGIVAIAWP